MTRQDLPNLITLIRILLVAPLAWALLDGRFGLALALFAVASASDGLDGYLARRFGWQSPLGALLDPIADKLLLVSTYLLLGDLAFLPWWLVGTVIGRDLVILSGAGVYRMLLGHFDMAPSLVSKLNTVLQISLVLIVLMASGLNWLPVWSAGLLVYAVFASTVLSGAHYVAVWSRRAWRERRRARQ